MEIASSPIKPQNQTASPYPPDFSMTKKSEFIKHIFEKNMSSNLDQTLKLV